jgi:heavy metal sensor kinase
LKSNSLRFRVTAWYLGLLAVALGVLSVAVYVGVRSFVTTSLENALIADARTVGTDYLAGLETKGNTWFHGEIEETYPPGGSSRFVRITEGGKVIYTTGDLREPAVDAAALPLPVDVSRWNAIHREWTPSGQRMIVYTMPYRLPSGRQMVVETAATMDPIRRIVRSLFFILLITTPTILVAGAIGGFFLMSLPLRPVVRLTEQAEHIGRNELGERLPVIASGDELERLSLSLNRMIDRLEEALAHNHRFSADASHELRTPLTILQGELEAILGRDDLPGGVPDGIASALEEIERMARIVHSLMTISRLDAGGERMELAPLDLARDAANTLEHMRLIADEKSITLTFAGTAAVYVDGDAMRLKQVLVNLVDNAIKYTPAGGSVLVSVAASGDEAVLEVTDSGIGIPPASVPHVFDRFYRTDKARTRESGGLGLGLSIVKAIVVAHQGAVTVASVEGSGSTFRVGLPLLRLTRAQQEALHATGRGVVHLESSQVEADRVEVG